MSDIDKALEFISEHIGLAEQCGCDDPELMEWRRIEVLLMKLSALEARDEVLLQLLTRNANGTLPLISDEDRKKLLGETS